MGNGPSWPMARSSPSALPTFEKSWNPAQNSPPSRNTPPGKTRQSWLYTKRNDFAEYDLHVEFWTRTNGNSGISIRDSSRAKYGITTPPDYKRTPSKIGYEIQINNRYPDPHPTGSIYGFADAKPGACVRTTGIPWTSPPATTRSPFA